ncbi:MAG: cytochrome b/b6 domain-containing protein [Gammaproteobacteria bacterium]
MAQNAFHVHPVWDAPIRWFHWINFLAVIGLIGIGLVILNGQELGLSNQGKVMLKTVHVWVGYVLVLNLVWRLIWGFIGNRYARWSAVLPFGQGYFSELKDYVSSTFTRRPSPYLGHNPLGRIAVTVLLLLLLGQSMTGLVLAGTDIFYPPLGHWIARWVAAPGVDPSTLVPLCQGAHGCVGLRGHAGFSRTLHHPSRVGLLRPCSGRCFAYNGGRDGRGSRGGNPGVRDV